MTQCPSSCLRLILKLFALYTFAFNLVLANNLIELPKKEKFTIMRHKMVADQIKARGIQDEKVINALEAIPREDFIPKIKR